MYVIEGGARLESWAWLTEVMLREVETQAESKEQKDWATPEDQEVKVELQWWLAKVLEDWGRAQQGLAKSPEVCGGGTATTDQGGTRGRGSPVELEGQRS